MTGTSRRPFDLAGRLPSGVTSIEASAGTGKTYTLAGLATRYLAEGGVSASELLIVTFTRAATSELRARVRDRMIEAAAFLDGTGRPPAEDDVLLHCLSAGDAAKRWDQLQRAITEFDAATITTIHGFATQVRQTLGTTAGIDPDCHLVDDVDEMVDEVCGDILAAASVDGVGERGLPTFEHLRSAVRVAAGQSDLILEPNDASRGADPGQVLMTELVRRALAMLDRRRRSRGTVSFDDVLVQLRDVLRGPGAAGVIETLRNRFKVVLIDEFQDTDRVQWDIFSTLFGAGSGTSLVLVGDPKQAIYRFRGADIGAYLEAVGRVGTDRYSLATNWRSDGAMLEALAALFDGVTFGDDSIGFVPVGPALANRDRRLGDRQGGEGQSRDLPALMLRLATAPAIDRNKNTTVVVASAGYAVGREVAAYVRELLGSAELPPTKEETDPRPVRPSDIAVLVRTGSECEDMQAAFRREGIPAVVAAAGNVLESSSALQLRYLLHAMERPSDARIVRTYALSWFAGWNAARVAVASDDELVPLQEQLADWAALFTGHPVAEVLARVWADTGVVARVLGAPDGDRDLTDLDHLAELLHGAVPRGVASVAALLAVLDAAPEHDDDPEVEVDVAARRIESEAEAVQIMTIWKAKGLEFPVVCVPTLWRFNSKPDPLIYTDPETGVRTFDLTTGEPWPDKDHAAHRKMLAADELAGERLRLLYVALTRAKHQTAVWWANAPSSGKTALAHVLFARSGASIDPAGFAEPTVPVPADGDIVEALMPLVERAPGIIEVVSVDDRHPSAVGWVDPDVPTKPARLRLARFDTVLDRSVHRWSFSSMTDQATSGGFDPYDQSLADGGANDEDHGGEETGPGIAPAVTADAGSIEPGEAAPPAAAPVGPLAHLPAGAAFGTLVHAVLEKVDFASDTLDGELGAALDAQLLWSGMDLTPVGPGAVPVEDGSLLVVAGLRLAIETPLGGPFAGRRLADLAEEDRLNEVSFDMRLGQGGPPLRVEDIGVLVASYLESPDPLASWAAALAAGSIDIELSGYLTGSIDLVARVRDGAGGTRFVVADYKTNQLTHRGSAPRADDYGPDKLAAAMIEHHYPLQALLYAVAVHRYLRWRQPGYRPELHLGGASYLFVRGMTGPTVATTDGSPHGVFNWSMAPEMVVGLSDLLDGRVTVGA